MSKKKKDYVSKGFWTRNGRPTDNAVRAYVYIIEQGGEISDKLLNEAQRFVGVPSGKDSITMLMWGINVDCFKSRTSSQRAIAMSKAYDMAKSLNAMGMRLCTLKP